jgi:hypothetical protein
MILPHRPQCVRLGDRRPLLRRLSRLDSSVLAYLALLSPSTSSRPNCSLSSPANGVEATNCKRSANTFSGRIDRMTIRYFNGLRDGLGNCLGTDKLKFSLLWRGKHIGGRKSRIIGRSHPDMVAPQCPSVTHNGLTARPPLWPLGYLRLTEKTHRWNLWRD